MTVLEKFNKIPVYGKPVTKDDLYYIKWRLTIGKGRILYKKLVKQHPNLKVDILWYVTMNKEHVLIGGKFDAKSGIKETASRILMQIPKGS